MKKYWIATLFLAVLFISGCTESPSKDAEEGNIPLGDKPPTVGVEIGHESYDTRLGAYCWEIEGTQSDKVKADCVDVAGAVDLLEDEEAIQVEAGETIAFVQEFSPEPSEVYLTQSRDGTEIDVEVTDHEFTVPTEKGIYYYDYDVWWKDNVDEDIAHGDASYAFMIEVI